MSDKHVDIDTVKYISKLSKLKFTDNEAKKLAGEFEAILGDRKSVV